MIKVMRVLMYLFDFDEIGTTRDGDNFNSEAEARRI